MKRLSSRFQPRLLELTRGSYSWAYLVRDALAGGTVALIALPLALALGLASVPAGAATPFPALGLGVFTAIIAGFIVSALGGSRVQIGGPNMVFVPVALLIIERHGYDGMILATIMAGVILLVMGLTRMGTLIKFIPYPVTSGFTSGVAITILLGQVAEFIGIQSATPVPREFFEKIPWLLRHIPDINPLTAIVGITSALFIYYWPRMGWRRLPGSIIALVVATAAVTFLGWQELYHVATVGSKFGTGVIPDSLPPFTMPVVSLARVRDLLEPATTIALLCSIESLTSAMVADNLVNDRHDANTELVAQGFANILCPFFCGLPACGGVARTSANIRSGGRTPVSGIVYAAALLVLVIVLARFAQYVPVAAISAVLVMVAYRMGEWHELARLGDMPRSDAVVLVTTLALTVIFDLVIAVEVGMVLAALLFIRRMSDTTEVSLVTTHDELETQEQVAHGKDIPEGVLVYRIFGPFFYGAANKMETALQDLEKLPRVLILRLQLVPAMDLTALNALENIVERIHEAGGVVILSGPHRQPLQMLMKAGFIEKIGRLNIRAHFDDALDRAREVLRKHHGVAAGASPTTALS